VGPNPKSLVKGRFADPEPTGRFPHRQALCNHALGARQLVGIDEMISATGFLAISRPSSAPDNDRQLIGRFPGASVS
jgi:hypothetical protein